MASGSITMSSTPMLYFSVATWISLRTSSTRRAGSSGISSSSFGSPITAAPYFFTSGRIALEPLVLGRHRVDQRLALVGGQARVQHLDDGRVDDQRQVGQLLDQGDGLPHELRLVGQRRAHVHVEQHGPAGHLLLDVDLHPGQVAAAQLQLEDLPAGRVDPLADDRERLVVTDPHRLGRRGQDGVHGLVPLRAFGWC